jgi:hypothetical protein
LTMIVGLLFGDHVHGYGEASCCFEQHYQLLVSACFKLHQNSLLLLLQ